MPSNDSIDGQLDCFFAWVIFPLRFLARHSLPAAMAAYVYAMELWSKCVVQINRTLTAILDSFHNEIIYFYEDANHYFPVVTVCRSKPNLISGQTVWAYDIHTRQFIHNEIEEPRLHRIPYLGASLTYTYPGFATRRDETIGDLSDWMADQTILSSTNELPFQVLVSAWAFCNQIPIPFDWNGFHLTVMNEEGDEISYFLSELDDISINTSSSTSIASSTDEIQGNIQIIGERILPQSLYDLLIPTVPTNTPLPASPETVSSVESEEEEEKKDK